MLDLLLRRLGRTHFLRGRTRRELLALGHYHGWDLEWLAHGRTTDEPKPVWNRQMSLPIRVEAYSGYKANEQTIEV